MVKVKGKRKSDSEMVIAVTFDTVEEFLDIFVEELVEQAQEENYPKARLKKFVAKRIEEIYSL